MGMDPVDEEEDNDEEELGQEEDLTQTVKSSSSLLDQPQEKLVSLVGDLLADCLAA